MFPEHRVNTSKGTDGSSYVKNAGKSQQASTENLKTKLHAAGSSSTPLATSNGGKTNPVVSTLQSVWGRVGNEANSFFQHISSLSLLKNTTQELRKLSADTAKIYVEKNKADGTQTKKSEPAKHSETERIPNKKSDNTPLAKPLPEPRAKPLPEPLAKPLPNPQPSGVNAQDLQIIPSGPKQGTEQPKVSAKKMTETEQINALKLKIQELPEKDRAINGTKLLLQHIEDNIPNAYLKERFLKNALMQNLIHLEGHDSFDKSLPALANYIKLQYDQMPEPFKFVVFSSGRDMLAVHILSSSMNSHIKDNEENLTCMSLIANAFGKYISEGSNFDTNFTTLNYFNLINEFGFVGAINEIKNYFKINLMGVHFMSDEMITETLNTALPYASPDLPTKELSAEVKGKLKELSNNNGPSEAFTTLDRALKVKKVSDEESFFTITTLLKKNDVIPLEFTKNTDDLMTPFVLRQYKTVLIMEGKEKANAWMTEHLKSYLPPTDENIKLANLIATQLTDSLNGMIKPNSHFLSSNYKNLIEKYGEEAAKSAIKKYFLKNNIGGNISSDRLLNETGFFNISKPINLEFSLILKDKFIEEIEILGYTGNKNPAFSDLKQILKEMSFITHPDKQKDRSHEASGIFNESWERFIRGLYVINLRGDSKNIDSKFFEELDAARIQSGK